MDRSRRRLTFTVGTSLLTASLATGIAGCGKKQTVNVHPDEVAEPTSNEGPIAEPADPDSDPDEIVNEGPVADEEPADPEDADDELE